MEVAILFGLVIVLLLIGVPIAVSLGLSSILFLLVLSDTSLASIAQSFFRRWQVTTLCLRSRFLSLHRPSCRLAALHKELSDSQLP